MVDYEFVAETFKSLNNAMKIELWNGLCKKKKMEDRMIGANDKTYFDKFFGADYYDTNHPMSFVKMLTDSDDYTYREDWVNIQENKWGEKCFCSSNNPTELMGIDTDDELYWDLLHHVADKLFE